jgi:hypothetical protein
MVPMRLEQREWLPWADLRLAGFDSSAHSDLKGDQINVTAGLTRKLSPTFLVGVIAGYETFDYTSELLAGRLTGDGWTTGGYLGWRFAPHWRLDVAVARAWINYHGNAGTAGATFDGSRWLISGGLVGTYDWRGVEFESSGRVYALWQHERAYLDSLGTNQPERNFETGRISAGANLTYPFAWSPTTIAAPYFGIYGDYYYSYDPAAITGLPPPPSFFGPSFNGWSPRFTSGLGVSFDRGMKFTVGAELGGIGTDHRIWSLQAHGTLPF